MTRKLQKWTSLLLAMLLLTLSLTACGASESMTESVTGSWSGSDNKADYVTDAEMPKEELGFENAPEAEEMANENRSDALAGRKLIYTYNADLQTLTFDETIEKLEAAVQKAGGYIERSSQSGSGAIDYGRVYERSADYTLRIPSDAAGAFVEGLASIASITHSNQGIDDVTDYYYDSEARLNNLRVQETRLLELLAQAENMGDMITIEQALSEVRYQIESLDGTIRRLDNEIEFSTVNLYIQEVFEASKLQAAPLTLSERISNRFSRSIEDIKDTGEDLIVWLIGDSLIILIWVVIIAAVILVLRKMRIRLPKRDGLKRPGTPVDTDEEK